MCSTLWFACWAKIASLAMMNEKGSFCDEEHTFFYDACFLFDKADRLCRVLVDRLPRWRIVVPRGNFNAESTFSIVFTFGESRYNDGLYGTGFEYR